MWNGLGPHQYRMLPMGTIVRMRGQTDETIWKILGGHRLDCGHIMYRIERKLGSRGCRFTVDQDEIQEVICGVE